MRKRRWNKWDIAGVSLALLLLPVLAFLAYLKGTIFPHHLKFHETCIHPRVWISVQPIKNAYGLDAIQRNNIKFFKEPYASFCETVFRHEWWYFYSYCPREVKGQALCN